MNERDQPSAGHPPARLLVVDDERPIRRFLRVSLSAEGYEVIEAEDGAQAVERAAVTRPDLIILDLGLPDGDGIAVIGKLREWSEVPIIVLSVRGQETDKVGALDAGADDYLAKPFSSGELLARIRVALRRSRRPADDPLVNVDGLVVDIPHRLVTVEGREVNLTATEYTLLRVLALNLGKVLTHRELLRTVWGPGYENESHLLRVNVSNLRKKIEPDPVQPSYIVTEPGVGYRLRAK